MISDIFARIWRRSPAAVAVPEWQPVVEKAAGTIKQDLIVAQPMIDPRAAHDSGPIETDRLPIGSALPPASPITDLAALSPAARRQAMLQTITPALAWLGVRGVPSDDRARVMLLAIAGQESDCQHRRQIGGPARGLWQFESGGGVRGVLMHKASGLRAAAACQVRGVKPEAPIVHAALEADDVLAAMFARLLLWTDARPLPGDEGAGWDYYLRNWRPGKPHPDRWGLNWRLAREAVG